MFPGFTTSAHLAGQEANTLLILRLEQEGDTPTHRHTESYMKINFRFYLQVFHLTYTVHSCSVCVHVAVCVCCVSETFQSLVGL